MKRYTIFAGVNGAGKTSIYESIYYTENKEEKRINADEMVALILVYFFYLGSVRLNCWYTVTNKVVQMEQPYLLFFTCPKEMITR